MRAFYWSFLLSLCQHVPDRLYPQLCDKLLDILQTTAATGTQPKWCINALLHLVKDINDEDVPKSVRHDVFNRLLDLVDINDSLWLDILRESLASSAKDPSTSLPFNGEMQSTVQSILVRALDMAVASHPNSDYRYAVGTLWVVYLSKTDGVVDKQTLDAFIQLSRDVDDRVASAFSLALRTVPPSAYISVILDTNSDVDSGSTSLSGWTYERVEHEFKNTMLHAYDTCLADSFLQDQQFNQVMLWLGFAAPDAESSMYGSLDTKKLNNLVWLSELYTSVAVKDSIIDNAKSDESDNTKALDASVNRKDLLLWWAAWETARYCVANKLKTEFGHAQAVCSFFFLTSSTRNTNADTACMKYRRLTKFISSFCH
jgi:hypothetical protein